MKRKSVLLAILMVACAWSQQLFAQEDVTVTYLQNADLSSLAGWDYGDDGFNYTDWKTDGDVPVIEFYHTWSPNAGASIGNTRNFHFSQTVTLPAGNYRLAVNGFYREGNGNGTNTKAYIFAGEKQQFMVGLTSAGVGSYSGSNDLYKAANAFSKGDFSNAFDFDLTEEQTIEIGFRGYIDTYCSWCILGPVKLYKYSLDDYLVDYRAKVSEAEALYSTPMNAEVLQALKDAVKPESSFSLVKDVTDALSALNDKIAAAKNSAAVYAATKATIDEYDAKAAANLSEAGKAAYDAAVAAIKSGYANGSMTADESAAVRAAYAAGVKKQTEAGSDYTEAAPADWVGATGAYQGRSERYNASDWNPPYEYTGDVMTQTIEGMPAGAYKVVLEAAASFTSGRGFTCKTGDGLAVVFANNQTIDLPVVDRVGINNDAEYGPIEVIGKVGDDGVLKYGIQKLDEIGGNWFVVKLVSITKVDYVPVASITASDITVEQLKTAEVGAVVNPANATLPQMTYTIADEAIATVGKWGTITGVTPGQTTLTITADDVVKVINVTVTEPAVLPQSIQLTPAEFALDLGDNNTATLAAAVLPAEAEQGVTFASADPAVATVNAQGEITATGFGTTTITVASVVAPEVTATATVTVSAAEAPAIYASEIEDGVDYWIVNAATGKFLGGANSWGTRLSLIKHGIPFKAAVNADDETVTLDSYTSNGGNNHFLAGEWIDGAATPFTILPADNGAFTINYFTTEKDEEGNDITVMRQLTAKTSNTMVDGLTEMVSGNLFAQWYFISRDQLIEGLSAANEKNPVDATFLIKDYNFSRNNTQYAAWEKTAGITNSQNPRANDGSTDYNWNVERFHNSFKMSQAVAVPNGTYRLTAQGFYRQDGEDNDNLAYFFANDQVQAFPLKTGAENSMNDAAASFEKGLYKIEPIIVEVTDNVLNIGAINEVNTNLWCIWDNFELECIGVSQAQGIPVTISEAGYATLYYGDLNLAIPEGVAACTATVNEKTINLSAVEGVIPAATPVVLQGNPGTYTFPICYDNVPAINAANQLNGSDEAVEVAEEGYKYYILSTKDNDPATVGFYFQVAGGASVSSEAHKAYLAVPEEVAAGASSFVFNVADGIQNVVTANAENGETYTLSGVRVSGKLAKGVYVVNGKKVVVK